MGLTSAGVDIGIVVSDGPAAVAFYRDVIGLTYAGDNPMPVGGGTMYRLMAGETMIKLVQPDPVPTARATAGAIDAALGYRYITFSVDDIDASVAACRSAGVKVVTEATIMPGVRIALVEDPDSNLVEFLEMKSAPAGS
jgi:catechol 2,3-dioxygenase-like lactoylglutathione lyase family enzyme